MKMFTKNIIFFYKNDWFAVHEEFECIFYLIYCDENKDKLILSVVREMRDRNSMEDT